MVSVKVKNFVTENCDLVKVGTENGVSLLGFLSKKQKETDKLFIMSHGRGGLFYSGYDSFLPFLVDAAHGSGFDFLGVSDRGSGFFRIYDIFEECVADYSSWVEFAQSLGYSRIVLGAHSYGPIKITHYYDLTRPKCIKGLFYLAPTDTYGIWKNFVGGRMGEYLNLASKMLKEGFGKDLMPKEAYYKPISAQSYVSLYAENSKIHIFDFQNKDFDFEVLKRINIPVLGVLGGSDINPLDSSSKEKLKMLNSVLKKPAVKIVEGANHVFSNKGRELENILTNWLKSI